MKIITTTLIGKIIICALAALTTVPAFSITNTIACGDDKADLKAYCEQISGYYAIMTDSDYDDTAFTAGHRDSLAATLNNAQTALNNDAGDFSALLTALKEVYERVPYVSGGKKWWRISAGNLSDGSTFMLEPAHTDYHGRFMVAHPENRNESAVTADDEGKQEAALWQLEATGQTDPIFTGKPTYYFRHVETGLYFGVSDTVSSINQAHKRMVGDRSKAYAFCILTLDEVKAHDSISVNGYGNPDAVVVQHSNADGTWFRLTRFGGYKHVFYISPDSYPTSTMWPAWNLYTGQVSHNIAGEMEQALNDWGNLHLNAGRNPGYYSEAETNAYNTAVDNAKAISSENTRAEYRAAIDALDSAYHVAHALTPIPVSAGYYRILSANSSFKEKGQSVCAYDRGDGYLGFHEMDTTDVANIFLIEPTEGGWNVRNFQTGLYVGDITSDNKVTMLSAPTVAQTFTLHGEAQWKWSNTSTTLTYYTFGPAPGSIGRYYRQNALSSFDDWLLFPVSADIIDSIEMVRAARIEGKTLVVETPATASDTLRPVRLNWIKAQAAQVGQLNIMAIDVRNVSLADDCSGRALLSVSSQPNCLIYARSDQGLSGTNIVIDGQCETLELTQEPFRVPEPFTARHASLTINPAYTTRTGGWQTVAIPFDVSEVTASDKGTVRIETTVQSGDILVRAFTSVGDGVVEFGKLNQTRLQAYRPYALAVPGDEFGSRSLQGQTLTFSGENVSLAPPDSAATITIDNYAFVGKMDNEPVDHAWIINYEGNGFDVWANGTPLTMRGYFTCADTTLYSKGNFSFSTDISDAASSKRVLRVSGLEIEGGLTGLSAASPASYAAEPTPISGGIIIKADSPTVLSIADLSGRLIVNKTICGEARVPLPAGLYIVNGKKILIK